MGFMNNPAQGGDFDPYLKFNGKAGRFYSKNSVGEEFEVPLDSFTVLFDIANIKTGWMLFAAGIAPVKHFDPSLVEAAPNPGEGFKRGFELKVFSSKNLGGVREFASTAGVVIEAMNSLYDAATAAPEYEAGKLPVIKCTGVTPVTGRHGTNYRPEFVIAAWADRPVELPGPGAKPAPAAKTPPPAATGHVPPPAAKPAMAGGDDDVEF